MYDQDNKKAKASLGMEVISLIRLVRQALICAAT